MGWDIVFYARFPDREDPAVRFWRVMAALVRREGFEPLSSFAVLEDGDSLRKQMDLNDIFQGAERVTPQRVEAGLREHSGERIGFQGTWRTRRGGTHGAVTVTTFGAKVMRPDALPAPIDLMWDVGDSRRYVPGSKDDMPSVEAVMNDVAVLVELGADSIWGVDGDKVLSPDHLYAVFHRDPDRYRDDGGPPFPSIPIDEECVRAALEVGKDRRAVETPAGPIVYHMCLGQGRLTGFYDALQGAVEFAAREQS